jgi:hypothetical protein
MNCRFFFGEPPKNQLWILLSSFTLRQELVAD